MTDAPTIWRHAQKFSGSFDTNYYGPVVSVGWVMPKLTPYQSCENLTFHPSTTHRAQKNCHTPMRLA